MQNLRRRFWVHRHRRVYVPRAGVRVPFFCLLAFPFPYCVSFLGGIGAPSFVLRMVRLFLLDKMGYGQVGGELERISAGQDIR